MNLPACGAIFNRLKPALICGALLCVFPVVSVAADSDMNSPGEILDGRWSGTIAGAFRNQDVSWRFATDENGRMTAFMGPSRLGMPTVPLHELSFDGRQLSFSIPEQHARFTGIVAGDEVRGQWQQGTVSPVVMHRKIFAFTMTPAVQQSLIGDWSRMGNSNSLKLHFRVLDDGRLAGFLDTSQPGLKGLPLVDLFISENGLSSFRTDNGRFFSGRLANGVLVGTFRNGSRQTTITLLRDDLRERGYPFDLPAGTSEKLAGRWERKPNTGIFFSFEKNEQGQLLGFLEIPRERRREAIIELKVQANILTLLSISGRTFSGTLGTDEMSGQYQANNKRPSDYTFIRKSAGD